MRQMLGDEYDAFRKALEEEPYQALRLNALKKNDLGRSAAEIYGMRNDAGKGVTEARGARNNGEKNAAARYGGESGSAAQTCFGSLTSVPWAEDGYYYGAEDRPGRHPCHEAGIYYIQEPSAMLPASLLQVQPGERVLDLCAAPGGKSTQLAAKMDGKGFLLCNEIHPGRARILSENVERMGIRNACVTNETPERLAEYLPGFFQKVLVDAPCSGEGMFRKNEAACGEWSPENVRLCAKRQDGILDQAAKLLAPGGRLVYSTCTFSEEENERCIDRFLARHPEFHAAELPLTELGLSGCQGGREGTIRLWPHKIKGEGHFAAALEKEGRLPGSGGREMAHASGSGGTGATHGPGSGGREMAHASGSGGTGATHGPRSGGREMAHDFDRDRTGMTCVSGNGRKGLQRTHIPGEKEVPRSELGEYLRFCRENLRKEPGASWGGYYIRFGDHLYLAPEEMPGLKGLKVLRPGLHLGELKKNRFEPSHALALAFSPREAAHVWNLRPEDATTALYLNGGTFPALGEKGWYLICVDSFSLGWGKLAGGVMKNHYPRGLRV
ncbi:MAG: RsmF rRNA methyltransferase first C-terminal domain-containing protein [Roseburia sp.]|nr:RsmF rRNA methyltransferase first C-terminal domain-containing protein [Roseburia sp.]MCM1098138.1 RsmF rRNA methyltransferase first C-terminal domain-containing protein [Ruminococcus flavefaciens]